MNFSRQHEEEPQLCDLQINQIRIGDVDEISINTITENESNASHTLTSESEADLLSGSHNVPKVHFADTRSVYSDQDPKPTNFGLKSCLKKSRAMQNLNFIEEQLRSSRESNDEVDHCDANIRSNGVIPHSPLRRDVHFDHGYCPNSTRNRNLNFPRTDAVNNRFFDRDTSSEIRNKATQSVIPSTYEFYPVTSNAIRPILRSSELGMTDNYRSNNYRSNNYRYMSNLERHNPTMSLETYPRQISNEQTSPLTRRHYQNQVSPSLQTSLTYGLYYHNHDESPRVPPACPLEASYQEEEIINIGDSDVDEDIRNLIETIKNDIKDMTERHEHVEIEKNRYLIRELEDILSIYRMTFDMETDILSDVASTSSYQSVTTEATAHSTQTSSSLTPSSTNLSKTSDCSSSSCLTSDNDFIDEDRSTSSSVDKYEMSSSDWTEGATASLTTKTSTAPVLEEEAEEVNKHACPHSDPQVPV